MLCDEFFSKNYCACIHYHSHTYIRHRDIASLLPRHTSVNTLEHAEGLHFSAFIIIVTKIALTPPAIMPSRCVSLIKREARGRVAVYKRYVP